MLYLPIIENRLQKIDDYTRILESFQKVSFENFEKDIKLILAVERCLHVLIEAALDIGNHILSSIVGETPDSYAQTIKLLGEKEILPLEFVSKIQKMAGFRNILVHEYMEVDLNIIYQFLQEKPDDFREFNKYIRNYLKKLKL